MFRRPMARGLIGTMATTAVVAGTATAVSGRVARRQANRARSEALADEPVYAEPTYAQPAYAAPAPGPPAGPPPDMIEQLTQLAALKDQGVLTDDEFAVQKARILGP